MTKITNEGPMDTVGFQTEHTEEDLETGIHTLDLIVTNTRKHQNEAPSM